MENVCSLQELSLDQLSALSNKLVKLKLSTCDYNNKALAEKNGDYLIQNQMDNA